MEKPSINCVCKDHRDKIKVPDPVVKDLISKKIVEQIILKRARLISRSGKYIENDVLFQKVTQAYSEKKSECSYQESNLRPSDY